MVRYIGDNMMTEIKVCVVRFHSVICSCVSVVQEADYCPKSKKTRGEKGGGHHRLLVTMFKTIVLAEL